MDAIPLADLRADSRSSIVHPSSAPISGVRQPLTPSPARFLNHANTPGLASLSRSDISLINPTPSSSSSRTAENQHLLSTLSPTTTLVNDLPTEPRSKSHHSVPNNSHLNPHTAVPATEIFSRNAPPLHLPKLDDHLASISAPDFTQVSQSDTQMFPPMDRLVAAKMSIDDLQHNSTVPAKWRDRTSLLNWSVSAVVGLTGSSLLTTYYSLTGVVNTVQVFALIISTIIPYDPSTLSDYWRSLLLGTIPNVLALNFVSGILPSLIFLLAFMALTGGLLYWFYRSMSQCERYKVVQGLRMGKRPSQWAAVTATFLLTLLYLPLSTISVRVLVWSQDMWVVDNPYINATTLPPQLPPLGPANEYRDPLDFCWTTTMKRNEVNFAPAAIIASALTVAFLTVWYPIALLGVIKRSLPQVSKYNDLGRPRSKVEIEHEYEQILERDTNPFAFLYTGFRKEMGYYQPIYLWIKLSTLVIVAIFSADNCLFRNVSRRTVSIVSQSGLFLFTVFLWVVQSLYYPFLDPVNNASEWVSRMNFVFTAAITLALACDAPGSEILGTYVLWIVYGLTYSLVVYFVLINIGFVQSFIKRASGRVDFSVDIFSPRLDVTPISIHLRRRIWQESISTLILTDPQCKIPPKQTIVFAESRDSKYPPYLVNFSGSPGERHVENLKIVSEIGTSTYRRYHQLLTGPESQHYKEVSRAIQRHHMGPDSFWKPRGKHIANCRKYWGNSWWIPFPPCLVMQYDEGPLLVLAELHDLADFIKQNTRGDIQQRRQVRLALRSLEGQQVYWPYEHYDPIGSRTSFWCCGRRGYQARTMTYMDRGVLKIKRQGIVKWGGFKFGSGFDVELRYNKGVTIQGDQLGLVEDFDLTAPLAQFLGLNEHIITSRLPFVEDAIRGYREELWNECKRKMDVLSYGFLISVYDHAREPGDLAANALKAEKDLRVRSVVLSNEHVFEAAYARYVTASRSQATAWWYIFWDDFWRRNYEAFSALTVHERDFNPYFPSSIAYTPLPRAALISFLTQRGLLSNSSSSIFHSGLLNKLYFRLNQTVFHHSRGAIMMHLGEGDSELDMTQADLELLPGESNLGTGGGTDYDDEMRPRPEYRWEGVLTDPVRQSVGRRNILAKTKAWFGISPIWRASPPSRGLALDVRLENGRFVLLEH